MCSYDLAMAIARLASVTVSIAAETIGVFSLIFLLNEVEVSTSLGRTFEKAGTSSTSSNVIPSVIILSVKNDIW